MCSIIKWRCTDGIYDLLCVQIILRLLQRHTTQLILAFAGWADVVGAANLLLNFESGNKIGGSIPCFDPQQILSRARCIVIFITELQNITTSWWAWEPPTECKLYCTTFGWLSSDAKTPHTRRVTSPSRSWNNCKNSKCWIIDPTTTRLRRLRAIRT